MCNIECFVALKIKYQNIAVYLIFHIHNGSKRNKIQHKKKIRNKNLSEEKKEIKKKKKGKKSNNKIDGQKKTLPIPRGTNI